MHNRPQRGPYRNLRDDEPTTKGTLLSIPVYFGGFFLIILALVPIALFVPKWPVKLLLMGIVAFVLGGPVFWLAESIRHGKWMKWKDIFVDD